MKIVLIKWIDAHGVSTEWEDIESLKEQKPILVKTIGFVQEENDEYIEVYQNHTKHEICGRMVIPRECIKDIRLF